MMTDVQKAIWVSDIPKSLNMNVETRFTAIKGSPMAKYAEGTHAIGFIDFSLLTFFIFPNCVFFCSINGISII
jgi:hypothetical protein